jgi:hypothetical protein
MSVKSNKLAKAVAAKTGTPVEQIEIREVQKAYTVNNEPCKCVWYAVRGNNELKSVKL